MQELQRCSNLCMNALVCSEITFLTLQGHSGYSKDYINLNFHYSNPLFTAPPELWNSFSEVTYMRAIVIEVSGAICLMNSMLGAVLSGQHPSGDEVFITE